MSSDGQLVAFWSYASNLVVGDANEASDVVVRDRTTGSNELATVSTSEEQHNYDLMDLRGGIAMSNDGRYVAFPSCATNLVVDDTNGFSDVFLRDRELGVTERVSLAWTIECVRYWSKT